MLNVGTCCMWVLYVESSRVLQVIRGAVCGCYRARSCLDVGKGERIKVGKGRRVLYVIVKVLYVGGRGGREGREGQES